MKIEFEMLWGIQDAEHPAQQEARRWVRDYWYTVQERIRLFRGRISTGKETGLRSNI